MYYFLDHTRRNPEKKSSGIQEDTRAKYKLYSRLDIFKHIKKSMEKIDLKKKYKKVLLNIKFIEICKQGHLSLTFAKVQLSIKIANYNES